jgi:predicted GNAT family acetyltransferase
MKKLVSRTLILAVVLGFGLGTLASAQDGTWTGWVTDDHCGAAGAKAAHADCAAKCVKEKGAHWAVYNPTDKSVFILSGDDAMIAKMAAKEVMIKGTMDKEKKTITVTSMEASAPAKAPEKKM